jgi:glucoamylase
MKTAAGTSRSDTSLVWFTVGRGVLNEIFYPRIERGSRVLFASRGDVAMAVLATQPFLETSVGFLEKSDALSDLREHGRLTDTYLLAEDGNVALIGEIDVSAGVFTVAYGFGLGPSEAAHHAYGALQTDFEDIKERYVKRWKDWQRSLRPLSNGVGGRDLYRISAATMRVHANKSTPGAVASLAVPWGEHRGDEDLLQGAYHLVWPRDLLEGAGVFSRAWRHRGDASAEERRPAGERRRTLARRGGGRGRAQPGSLRTSASG